MGKIYNLLSAVIAFLLFLTSTSIAQPVINSFTPLTGYAGSQVIISGSNFNPVAANNIVWFGAARAVVTNATSTSLSVTVPTGATYEPISVTANNLTGWSHRYFQLTYPGGGTLYPLSSFYQLYPNQTNGVGRGIITSDLDNDGRVDLVAVNGYLVSSGASQNTISVFQNTGTGNGNMSFSQKIDLSVGFGSSDPEAAGVTDLDGDGYPDIVAADNGFVTYLKNNAVPGTISFSPYINISGLGSWDDIALADFDGDGKPDVAALSHLDSTITLYTNTSSGGVITFAPKKVFPTGDLVIRLAVADIDGDGRPDLMGYGSCTIHLNTSVPGTISFADKIKISGTGGYSRAAAKDIDGDGLPELCYAGSDSAYVLLNKSTAGSLLFDTRKAVFTGSLTGDINASDVDGDGKTDLFESTGTNRLSVFKFTGSEGNISFDEKKDFSLGTSGASETIFCDVNGDGRPDLISSLYGVQSVAILPNKVNQPTISSFYPAIATTGDTVVITGTNFAAATAVSFGGANAQSFIISGRDTIKAIVATGATGSVQVTTSYGSFSKTGFNFTLAPVITAFTPGIAGAGDAVIITGSNFLNTSSVNFGGITARSFSVVNANKIIALVDSGSSGSISVGSQLGTFELEGFRFVVPPVITSFSPLSGAVGTTVTITGENFSPVPSENIVYCGTVKAIVNSSGENTITITIPSGATLAPITVSRDIYTAYSTQAFNITFPEQGAPFTPQLFIPRNGSIAGINMRSVATLDVDGDGKADIVRTSSDSGRIYISRNNSSGQTLSFEAPVTAALSSGVSHIIFADINGDTKPDIITSAFGIDVFLNNSTPGTISFAPPLDLGAGSNSSIAAADIDGDGKVDIAGVSGNSCFIYRNRTDTGKVYFTETKSYITGGQANDLVLTDLDNDNKPDIAVVNYFEETLSILKNTSYPGTFSFTNPLNYTAGKNPGAIATGDFNGDGFKDLVVTTTGSGKELLFFKNISTTGNLRIAQMQVLATTDRPEAIVVTDLNGDNKPDLAVASSDDSTISVYRNTSTADLIRFDNGATYHTTSTPRQLIAGDFNNDGLPDLVFNNGRKDSLDIFENNLYRPVISSFSPDSGNVGTTVTINGYNFNGATKVNFGDMPAASFSIVSPSVIKAVTSEGVDGNITIQTAKGIATGADFAFAPPVINSVSPEAAPLGSSVTITGKNFSAIAGNNFVYFGPARADVTSASTQSLVVKVPPGASYDFITVTTHRLTAYSRRQFHTSFGYGVDSFSQSSFGPKKVFSLSGNQTGLCMADFDGDGKPDLATTDLTDDRIYVLRNNSELGQVSFENPITFDDPYNPVWMASGDINGDGKPDIITSHSEYNFMVFINTTVNGTISFKRQYFDASDDTSPLSYPEPGHFSIHDMDRDGKPDIIFSDTFGRGVYILWNRSSKGIVDFSYFDGVGSNVPVPGTPSIAYLNEDNLPDIMAPSTFTNEMVVARNATVNGSQVFFNEPWYFYSRNTDNIQTGDLDGDGKPDVVLAGYNVAVYPGLTVLSNNSIGDKISFVYAMENLPNTNPVWYNSAISDLDGDGRPDIISASVSNGIELFKNKSRPGHMIFPAGVKATDSQDVGYIILSGDLDGDGKPEVIWMDNYGGVVVLQNLSPTTPIPAPSIISFDPVRGSQGTIVTITGSFFRNANAVSIGGVPVSSFTIESEEKIVAVVGTGASGAVSVTTPGGTASKDGFIFTQINQLVLYPNPAGDYVIIQHPGSTGIAKITLLNSSGIVARTVNTVPGTTQTTMNLRGIPPGLYRVIWSDGTETRNGSLIIN